LDFTLKLTIHFVSMVTESKCKKFGETFNYQEPKTL